MTVLGARLRGVVRRLVKGSLIAAIVATGASLLFNLVTTPPRTIPAPNGSDVQVGGTRVHYETWGSHGTPIVLVHGFAESTLAWVATARQLARDHVVYALDLPGFGYSQHSGHYGLTDQTDVLSGFISAVGVQRPIVVGHSLGAGVVGLLALQHPDQVRGVVFADGDALPFDGRSRRSRVSAAITATPFFTSLYRIGTRWDWLDRQIVLSQCGSRCSGYSDELVTQWMRPLTAGDAETAMASMARQPMPALTAADIRRITVPRGIIWGEEDATSGGSLAGARTNLHNPPTVVIPKAGHLPMISDPAAFAAAVESVTAHMPRHGG